MQHQTHQSIIGSFMNSPRVSHWVWSGVVAIAMLAGGTAQAQVIPDATLGAGNNSVTATTGNRTDILGGLRRNSSLFHSFDRFDVLTNQQVYFANPADIRNIFSRVTGGNISNIDGLLGVSGSANLFLMNPNGIIFGPNTRLDVAGSFFATTANALEFADNQKFAATGDRAVPLVEVNIPIGLQMGANAPAMLTNRGNLAVGAGQSLTLAGGTTTHSGSLTAPGGTVQVLGNQVSLLNPARIDVSSATGGGQVLVGGGYQGQGSLINSAQTVVEPGVSIHANATHQGNGGRVIVWADGDTRFGGSITAQGGPQGGNGGFVEVSGKQRLAFQGQVDTRAFQGQAGTLLLDPGTLTISTGGTASPIPPVGAGDFTIDPTALATALDTGDIVLQADTAIVISNLIDSSANANANILTFNAPAIALNASVTTNGGQVYVGAVTLGTNNATLTTNNGSITFNSTVDSAASAGNSLAIAAGTGDVTFSNAVGGDANGALGNLTVAGGTTLFSNTVTAGSLDITANGTITGNGNVTVTGATTLAAGANNITFNQTGNNFSTVQITAGNNVTLVDTDDLDLGTSNIAGTLNVTANGDITANSGNLRVDGTTTLAANASDITLDQPGNNFNTLTITSGRNVTVRDEDGLNLGAITATTSAGASGNTISVTATGTLQLQNAITAADFGTITLQGSTVTANLGTNAITARAGTVNMLGSTINLNTGTIDVRGIGSKPSGGTVRFGSSFTDPTLTNANAINVDGAPPFRIEASPNAGGNRGQVFLYTNAPANITSILNNNGVVVSNGADINVNPTSIDITGGGIGFTDITVANGSTVDLGGNTFFGAIVDGATNHLYIAEAFLESISASFPTTGLTATNQFTINDLADDTLTLAGFPLFSAGNLFTMNAGDTITKTVGDFRIAVGNINVPNNAASLSVGALTTPAGGNLSLSSAGSLNVNGSLTTAGGAVDISSASGLDINNTVTTAGGNLTLTATGALNVNNTLNTAAIAPTSGGNIAITGSSNVTLGASSNLTTGGGSVTVRSSGGNLTASGSIDTSLVNDRGGNATLITTNGDINLVNSQITSINSGTNGFSQLWIEATNGSTNLTNSTITAANRPGAIGFAGDILINASNTIGISGSAISTDGNTGRILIGASDIDGVDRTSAIDPTPQTIAIANSTLTTTNAVIAGSRDSGSISLTAQNQVAITGTSSTLSAATSAGAGKAGEVTIQTPTLTVDGATISTAAAANSPALPGNTDPGGEITLRPFANNSIATLTVNLLNKANITASTAGARQGGSIRVTAPQSVTLSGNGSLKAETSGSGAAGEVKIATPDLTLQNGVQVSTSTTGTGTGGSILIGTPSSSNPALLTFADRVRLDNSRLDAETNGAGLGGNINIQAQNIGLTNNSVLNAGVRNTGNGGTIALSTNGGEITLDNSQISTAIFSTGTGNGNTITVNTGTLALENGARIQSQTSGTGNAGNIQLNIDTALTASGSNSFGRFSGILASSENPASGRGGDITINDTLNPRGQVTLANNGFLAANTRSNNDSGNIAINAANLDLRSGGQILTAAAEGSSGRAGSILVNATGSVAIADAVAPPTPTSPFTSLTVINLADADFQLGTDLNVFNAATIPFEVATAPVAGGFAYYGFNVAAGNSQGTFDIDGGYKLGAGSIDTQIFLFDRATGNLLAASDDSSVDPGSTPVFGSLTYDSFINYTFAQPGAYVLGVGAFPSSVVGGIAPITGRAPVAGQTYTLNLSLTSPGAGGAVNPINLNPNLTLDNGLLSSGLYASSRGTGAAGSITVTTPNLDLSNQGTIAATNIGSTGQDITLQGLNTLSLSGNSQITASTRTGTAGNIAVTVDQGSSPTVTVNNSRVEAAASQPGGQAGGITFTTPTVALTDATIAASNVNATTGGNITFNSLDTLNSLNSVISASTQSGVAGGVSINAGQAAAQLVSVRGTRATSGVSGSPQGSIVATATNGGNAGSVTINTSALDARDGALISASSANGAGTAGGVDITARTVALNNAAQISAETDAGGASSPANITLQGLQTLNVNNSAISSSTHSGTAGSVRVNAASQITLDGTGGITAAATQGGNAGGVNLTTPTLAIANGASVAVSSANGAGTAGNVEINANTVTLNNAAQISAETDAGGASSPANITLQGLQTLNVNNSLISSSTNSGTAGGVTVTATGQVLLNGTSASLRDSQGNPLRDRDGNPLGGIVAEARRGGAAGDVSITAGQVTVQNGARASVSSPDGRAGSLNVTTNDLRLTRGTLEAVSGDGDGANITLTVAPGGLLVMRDGSLISADARKNANGGNITIIAPFVIGPTFENNDIVANAIAGNGGQINITTNAIFGLQFRRNRTNRSDITASSETGSSGTVALNTLNIDPSKGLVELPEIPVDRANQLTQGCSTGGDPKNNESRFSVAGRGGVPASPTAPFTAATTTSDWVSLDPSPQTLSGVTFSNGITMDLVAQSDRIPVTCINAWKLQQRSLLPTSSTSSPPATAHPPTT